MRTILLLPLLALAACDVDNNEANNSISVTFDKEVIDDTKETAGEVASGLGNVAEDTGRAIKKEVGDIDVDVDVDRNRDGEAKADATADNDKGNGKQ